MSHSAYSEGIRHGVWKEKFTHWLPLYISHRHAIRAMPICKQMISDIISGSSVGFEPLMAAQLLTKLMNTMVVSLMKVITMSFCWICLHSH